ncbi:hypothetical protein [Helicobacter pylori]|uniref:hypothetical protein n=1 Tax=Helicobacter pylori TaxID=210 RepID=UPI001E5A4345|nr:hypothetical protein [Helicobacter pylori]
MWGEKIMKVIPGLLFLLALLGIFELVLIIDNMNKIEKIESRLHQDLEALELGTNLLNKH